jgi:hypothetical protein
VASDEFSEWAESYAHDPDRATRRSTDARVVASVFLSLDGGAEQPDEFVSSVSR